MPLKLHPTGLGSGIDKDRADYTVYCGGWDVGRIRPEPAQTVGAAAGLARPRTLPRLADQSERSPAARACPAPMWGAAAGMPLAAASAQSDWDVSRQGVAPATSSPGGPIRPDFRTIQVYPKDRLTLPRQG